MISVFQKHFSVLFISIIGDLFKEYFFFFFAKAHVEMWIMKIKNNPILNLPNEQEINGVFP